jgi:serine/threonine protein kinase
MTTETLVSYSRIDAQWERRITKGKLLGAGTYGSVYQATQNIPTDDTPVSYALKISTSKFNWDREVNAMSRLTNVMGADSDSDSDSDSESESESESSSPMHVCPKLYDAWITPSPATQDEDGNGGKRYYLLMELFDGSMDDFVMDFSIRGIVYDVFPLQFTSRMLKLAALLDKYKVLHGDLKPNNFLYTHTDDETDNITIVVSDFGFAELYDATSGRMNSSRHAFLVAQNKRICHADVLYPPVFIPRFNQLYLLGMIQSFSHERFGDPESEDATANPNHKRTTLCVQKDDASSSATNE